MARSTSIPNVALEAFRLRRFTRGRLTVKAGRIKWVGEIKPTPISDTYKVEVSKRQGSRRARVVVLDPPIASAEDEKLPHVFPGNELCLHYPGEWDGSRIDETLLPWIAEWLLHYELWRATGAWHGGGHEPERA